MRNLLLTTAILAVLPTITFAADVDSIEVQPIEPNWSITLGAMYLVRSEGKDTLFHAGAPIVGTQEHEYSDQLGHQSGFGIEAALAGQVGGSNVEIRGLWALPSETNWDKTSNTAFFGIGIAGADPGGFGLFGGGVYNMDAKRETTFASLEANMELTKLGAAEVFVGLRGFSIDDDLSLSVSNGALDTTVDVDVQNRMLGPQIGVRGTLDSVSSSAFQVEAFAKIGLMHNWATADGKGGGSLGGASSGSDSDSDNYWSGMAEVGINGKMMITNNMHIDIGYQALYFNNLATSTDTLGSSTFHNSSGPITTNIKRDGVLYHAAKIAAIWEF